MSCAAKTAKGAPCKLKVKNGESFCTRHMKTLPQEEVSLSEEKALPQKEVSLSEEKALPQATCVHRGKEKSLCGAPCEDTGKLSFCPKHRKLAGNQARIDRLAENEAIEAEEIKEVSVTPIGDNRYQDDNGLVYLTNGRFVLM